MTIYQGEWNEKVYAVAGDVLDGVSKSYYKFFTLIKLYCIFYFSISMTC